MDSTLKAIQNSPLAKVASGASSQVLNAIQSASGKTGVNFAYMVQQAAAESNFKPEAKAKTSSATGLYQFINSTWLEMVEKHGDKYGIDQNQSRSDLLDLRKDPEAASYMAAEFAAGNQEFLERHWGGEVGSTELYFAHFMGAGGASGFLKAHDANPNQQAALLFPEAAKANRNVFYDTATGRAKSLNEVYQFFDKKFAVEDVQAPEPLAVADAKPAQQAPHSVVFIDGQQEVIVWNKPPPAARETIAPFVPQNPLADSVVAAKKQPPPPRPSDFFISQQRNIDRTYGYVPRAQRKAFPSQNLVQNPATILMLSQLDSRIR